MSFDRACLHALDADALRGDPWRSLGPAGARTSSNGGRGQREGDGPPPILVGDAPGGDRSLLSQCDPVPRIDRTDAGTGWLQTGQSRPTRRCVAARDELVLACGDVDAKGLARGGGAQWLPVDAPLDGRFGIGNEPHRRVGIQDRMQDDQAGQEPVHATTAKLVP